MSATLSSTTRSPARTTGRTAAWAVLRAETRLFAREPGALFWVVAFPTLLVGVLALIPAFRKPSADLGGQSVIDLYVPVAVLVAMLLAGVQAMPAVLTGYRERGVLRRYRATPVSPAALLCSQVALHGAAVALSSVLVLLVGRVALGVGLPSQVAGYLLAFALLALVNLATGALITAVAPSGKVSQAIASVVFFPSMFTAGVWLPVQTMPDLMQRIVLWTPMGAGARALNDAATGAFPHVLGLLVMAGWGGVLGFAAVRLFRWE